MVARRLAFVALGIAVAASALACVKIPDNVEQTFAPAQPGENSYFRKRDDAPGALGFITLDDLKILDAGADAMPSEAGAASTGEFAGDASVSLSASDASPTSMSMTTPNAAVDAGADGGTR